jgi:hypothetical protein
MSFRTRIGLAKFYQPVADKAQFDFKLVPLTVPMISTALFYGPTRK